MRSSDSPASSQVRPATDAVRLIPRPPLLFRGGAATGVHHQGWATPRYIGLDRRPALHALGFLLRQVGDRLFLQFEVLDLGFPELLRHDWLLRGLPSTDIAGGRASGKTGRIVPC